MISGDLGCFFTRSLTAPSMPPLLSSSCCFPVISLVEGDILGGCVALGSTAVRAYRECSSIDKFLSSTLLSVSLSRWLGLSLFIH